MPNDIFSLVYAHDRITYCIGEAAVSAITAKLNDRPGQYPGNVYATRLAYVVDGSLDESILEHHEDAMAEVADLMASGRVTEVPPWFAAADNAQIIRRLLDEVRDRYRSWSIAA